MEIEWNNPLQFVHTLKYEKLFKTLSQASNEVKILNLANVIDKKSLLKIFSNELFRGTEINNWDHLKGMMDQYVWEPTDEEKVFLIFQSIDNLVENSLPTFVTFCEVMKQVSYTNYPDVLFITFLLWPGKEV